MKMKYLLISFLSIILILSLVSVSGCVWIDSLTDDNTESSDLYDKSPAEKEKALREALASAEEEIKADKEREEREWSAENEELLEGFEEEEKLIPN